MAKRTLRTQVRPSSISGAGLGLFMIEDACYGDVIARYSGDQFTAAEVRARSASDYLMEVNKDLFLDANEPHHWEGRYVNDGVIAGLRINGRFGSALVCNVCPVTGTYMYDCV